jgi:hypothetical protein
MVLPADSEAAVDGCFLPSVSTPTLLLMESQRDPDVGWGSSCLNLQVFPAFDLESVAPMTYSLGALLPADGVMPSLPPGGAPVWSERYRPNGVEPTRRHFDMCPEHPVFVLRGHDGGQPVAQLVSNVARSERGSLGPAVTSASGMLPCEENEDDE